MSDTNTPTPTSNTEQPPSQEKYTTIPNTDHWKTDDIIEIIETIYKAGNNFNERKEFGKINYPDFIVRYPMLSLMACEDKIDKKTLTYMMNMRNKVLNDECSVENASRVVGQKFYGKFVSPVVDTLNKNKK